ncbi:hypothetical protein CPB97_005199, partial [Podila verticillata]
MSTSPLDQSLGFKTPIFKTPIFKTPILKTPILKSQADKTPTVRMNPQCKIFEEDEEGNEDLHNDEIDHYEDDDDDVHSDLYGDVSVSTKAPRSRPAPASR